MTMSLRRLFVPTVILACAVLMIVLVCQAPSETQMKVMDYAAEQGVAYTDYPESLIDLLERNPETEEFVLKFPLWEEKKVDLSGYDLQKGVPLFLQWDQQWGYMTFSGDYAGITGSAPMCLSMTGYFISAGDPRFSPDRVLAFAEENSYGSGRELITRGGTALGLKATELTVVEEKITGYLKSGEPIIAAMKSGDGSFAGRYIVLTGYQNGNVTVNDPGSRKNSEKQWPFEEIAGQIKNLWVIHGRE